MIQCFECDVIKYFDGIIIESVFEKFTKTLVL